MASDDPIKVIALNKNDLVIVTDRDDGRGRYYSAKCHADVFLQGSAWTPQDALRNLATRLEEMATKLREEADNFRLFDDV